VIAAADTSPLCYLVLIGEIDLLPALFAEVVIPPGVAAELADPRPEYGDRASDSRSEALFLRFG
jgi:predicted nucleic acid-binding protein